jgi:hypothetical protein
MEINGSILASAKAAATKPAASLYDYLKTQDPALAKKTEETTRNLQNVLTALKSSKTDLAAQRKAAAAQKVAQIKQAIQALKLSSIVDPKMVARVAARLAKELATAVKEYASVGGASALSVASSSPGDQNKAADAATPTQGAEGQVNPDADTGQVKAVQSYEARQNDAAAKADHSDDRKIGTSANGDDAFKKDVSDTIEELRKLLRKNKGLLSGDKRSEDNVVEAEKALKESEKILATLVTGSGANFTAASSVSISA